MNIASDLLPNFLFCSAGFISFPDTHGYVEYEDDDEPSSYAESFGLEESLQALKNDWKIDFSLFGDCYAAIPQFASPLSPIRIDIDIPEQTQWPSNLWIVLGARDSVHMIRPCVNALGIPHHLRMMCTTHWSRSVASKRCRKVTDIYGPQQLMSSSILLELVHHEDTDIKVEKS